jgi:hypothetical protein
MPLYVAYVWSYAKAFGASEWALRAANMPWFVAGFGVLIAALPKERRGAMAVAVLVSPFAWYYLGEARSYTMQLSASMVCFGALYRLSTGGGMMAKAEVKWAGAFCAGVVVLSGSSLLGMVWAGAACLCVPVVLTWKRTWEVVRKHWVGSFVTVGLLAGIGVYYLWTLKVGARASAVGRTDFRNLLFIGYELLGFGGLGPGRIGIREGGLGAFGPFAKPLAAYGLLALYVMLLGGWQVWRSPRRRTATGVFLVLALPMTVLLGAGYAMHFRVLGRHFMPLLPAVLFVISLALASQWPRSYWRARLLGVGFVALSLISCLSLRFAERHEKDDYRRAAAVAEAALRDGKTVWWNAGMQGAVYYQLPVGTADETKAKAVWVVNPEAGVLAGLKAPDVVVGSKPDMYDEQGVLTEYLLRGGYQKRATMPAFTVWQRKGDAEADK